MIDYQKHRDGLKRGSLKVIEPGEDYGKQWLDDAQRAQRELFEDVEELLDKAEERDKDVKRVEVLENIIENIHAVASTWAPSLYQKIIDISANAIEDPAPVEEGKS